MSRMESQSWDVDPDVKAELEAMSGQGSGIASKKSTTRRKVQKHKAKLITKKSAKKEKASVSLIGPDQTELLKLLRMPTFTLEEKYNALEARDKLIRLRSKKSIDLSSAKHIIGTCPDMCPEKERLMREVRHQVSLYEQEPGEKAMNPHMAVKQYSRSSADQEVPLPHELRPVSVLQRTMCYLLQKIVHLCDSPDTNLAEWYHFLWDRTRGIRKDITQQELCCRGSVELVEQCARFHIHCSARLVAEDPSVFDHKINTENLTKCLQTLKYMYHDLEVKSESCPNEAEFRAYVILLNLNDGNFMWEVQQLRKEIQKSEEVQFALQVYSALDKNNYVRFFNLVRSTTYLNACILLRYFIQVRLVALNIILKSYSPRFPHTQFPLDELKQILAFESAISTIEFIEYHGVQVNDARTHIIVDRKSFQIPEFPYILDRAMHIIEAKRQLPVGAVICGRLLDHIDFDKYIPHNSFDANGLINISDYFSDTDLSELLEGNRKDLENEDIVMDDKIYDSISSFNKTTQESALHSNIFALKSNLESRSNSPLDNIDTGSNIKSEPSIFNDKHETNINLSMLAKSGNSSIFNMSRQETLGGFLHSPVSTQSSFGTNTQYSIFAKPSVQNTTSSSLPVPHSQVKATTAFTNVRENAFTTVTSNTAKTKSQMNVSLSPQTANLKSGGFTFNLKTIPTTFNSVSHTSTGSNVFTSNQFKPKGTTELLKEQKENAIRLEKELKEKIRKENEIKKRLEEERLIKKAAHEAEKTRRIREEEVKKKIQEEMLKRKLEDEEKQQLIKRKQLEESLRKMEELEEKKMFEIKAAVSGLLHDMTITVDCEIREEKAESILQRVRLRTASLFFNRWRQSILINKRKRKAIDQWPIWVNWTTLGEEAVQLHMKNQQDNLKYMKRYKSGCPIEIEAIRKFTTERIDLEKLTLHILKANEEKSYIKTRRYFLKFDVFIASLSYMNTNLKWIEDVINDLFDWKNNNYELLQNLNVLNFTVTYCIKRKESFNYESTDGYIFIGDDLSQEFYRDIKNIVGNIKSHSDLPIAILLQNDDYDNDLLNNLVTDNNISQYKVIVGRYTLKKLPTYIEKALFYIGENATFIPPLELDTLKSFLYKYLATEIWKKMTSFAKWNESYRICLTNPEPVISLYNEALTKLEDIVFDCDNREYKDFPEIFEKYLNESTPIALPCNYRYFPSFWKNDSYVRKLRRIFTTLSLPQFESKWPPENVQQLELMITDFCQRFFKQPIKKIYKIIDTTLNPCRSLENFSEIENVLWTNVIEVLIKEKLNEIDFNLRNPFGCIFEELFVVYNQDKLKEYQNGTWFYLNNPTIQRRLNLTNCKPLDYDTESEEEIEIDINLEATLVEVARERYEKEEMLKGGKRDLREFETLMADLEESIVLQKEINRKFEDILVSAINN